MKRKENIVSLHKFINRYSPCEWQVLGIYLYSWLSGEPADIIWAWIMIHNPSTLSGSPSSGLSPCASHPRFSLRVTLEPSHELLLIGLIDEAHGSGWHHPCASDDSTPGIGRLGKGSMCTLGMFLTYLTKGLLQQWPRRVRPSTLLCSINMWKLRPRWSGWIVARWVGHAREVVFGCRSWRPVDGSVERNYVQEGVFRSFMVRH